MWTAVFCLLGFVIVESSTSYQLKHQNKLIVYNVPKQKAIELVSGNEYVFIGDSIVKQNKQLQNFHIKPSHILFRLKSERVFTSSREFIFHDKRVLIMDSSLKINPAIKKDSIDLQCVGLMLMI